MTCLVYLIPHRIKVVRVTVTLLAASVGALEQVLLAWVGGPGALPLGKAPLAWATRHRSNSPPRRRKINWGVRRRQADIIWRAEDIITRNRRQGDRGGHHDRRWHL